MLEERIQTAAAKAALGHPSGLLPSVERGSALGPASRSCPSQTVFALVSSPRVG